MLAALLLPSLLTAGAEPPAGAVKLNEPRVQYRNNEASATRSPWIDANGWHIQRSPGQTFVYQVKGEAAALAAAEAFTYGSGAFISADAAGADAFGKMLTFIKALPAVDLPPVADFGVVDDGSDATGELLNLLTRMNLLYRIEKNPDPRFHVNVRLGTKEFPPEDAKNPSVAAHKIRSLIGDDNRSLRVYGSEVVIGRLMAGSGKARVFLINYTPRPVLGLRVRIRGAYSKGELQASGLPDARLADLGQDGPATEFTLPELHIFAVIDLSHN
ncbi:MAG TPA: hypothetical protein VK752_24460 [Bryobacteraceae bacterium]|jgi:hypothetical protein|nr:hypothetical protein [Bryobacteraceae bacterium]